MTRLSRRSISAVPLLTPREFIRARTARPGPLQGRNVSLWYSGRPAIYQAIKSLDIPAGQRVLVPAYACGSEVDALLKAGLVVDFYRIRADMTADLEHLQSRCEAPPAILYVTHYFGFSQPLDDLVAMAERCGARLIEDCAQALYSADPSGHPLGTRGDAGVFSLVKTLPLTDGGALVLNRIDEDALRSRRAGRPSPRAVLGPLKHRMEEVGLRHARHLTRGAKTLVGPVIRLAEPRGAVRASIARADDANPAYRAAVMDHMELKPERAAWGMSPVARFVFDRTPHSRIAASRRRNYEILAREMPEVPGARPMYAELPAHCCPLFFPLVVDEPRDLHRFLSARGIETKRMWSYFHDRMRDIPFPFETWLKTHVIGLPIHHQLGEEDMRYVVDAFRAWCTPSPAPFVASKRRGPETSPA